MQSNNRLLTSGNIHILLVNLLLDSHNSPIGKFLTLEHYNYPET